MQITALFIAALIAVESSGRDHVSGDNGQSLGCLQISQGVICDVNSFRGTAFFLEDRLDREKSIEICRYYLDIWGRQLERREGRECTDKDLALIWNMGPFGYRKAHSKAGRDYWDKVVEALGSGE